MKELSIVEGMMQTLLACQVSTEIDEHNHYKIEQLNGMDTK